MDKKAIASGKIRSAQQWLSRVEQDIGKDSTIKSQMDILLAEAELKSLKETLDTTGNKARTGIFSHCAAFFVATFLFVIVVGGYYWLHHTKETVRAETEKHQAIQTESDITREARPAQAVSAQKPDATHVAAESAVKVPESRQEVHGSTNPAGKEPPLSQDEIQRLIRAAGQSLRGQTKP